MLEEDAVVNAHVHDIGFAILPQGLSGYFSTDLAHLWPVAVRSSCAQLNAAPTRGFLK
jgi:hypothetical protein